MVSAEQQVVARLPLATELLNDVLHCLWCSNVVDECNCQLYRWGLFDWSPRQRGVMGAEDKLEDCERV